MGKYCRRCGMNLAEADRFCSRCGSVTTECDERITSSKHSAEKMYTLLCRRCDSQIEYEPTGNRLLCKGCGIQIVDKSAATVIAYERSDVCPRCGGNLSAHASGCILSCPYCDSTFLVSFRLFNVYDVDEIIPFTIASNEQAKEFFFDAAYKELCPDDFEETAVINKIQGVYIPYYHYIVSSRVHYALEVGHTETRRRYNSITEKYEDESYTVWEARNGNFDKEFFIYTKGFDESRLTVGQKTMNGKNLVEFMKMASSVSTKHRFSTGKKFHPLEIKRYEIIPLVDPKIVWNREGDKCLQKEISGAISRLYAERIRSIRFTEKSVVTSCRSVLLPMIAILYGYKRQDDLLMVLDGTDGRQYRGVLPESWLKKLLSVLKWVLPLCCLLPSTFNVLICDSSGLNMFYWLLSISLSVTVFVWLRSIKGYRDKNSEDARKSRKRNIVLAGGCLAVRMLMSLITVFLLLQIVVTSITNTSFVQAMKAEIHLLFPDNTAQVTSKQAIDSIRDDLLDKSDITLESEYYWQGHDVFEVYFEEGFSKQKNATWGHLGISYSDFFISDSSSPTPVDLYFIQDGTGDIHYLAVPFGEVQMPEVYYFDNDLNTYLLWYMDFDEYYGDSLDWNWEDE